MVILYRVRFEPFGLVTPSVSWSFGSFSCDYFWIKIMTWNCQGAASKEFMSMLKNFVKHNKHDIIVLLEPKILGILADKVCNKVGFDN